MYLMCDATAFSLFEWLVCFTIILEGMHRALVSLAELYKLLYFNYVWSPITYAT